jgi:RNA polymerase sigma-54 factor
MELGFSSNLENKVKLSLRRQQFIKRLQSCIPELIQLNITSIDETISYIDKNKADLEKILKQDQVEAFKRHLNNILKKQRSSIPPNYQYPDDNPYNDEDAVDNNLFFDNLKDIEKKAAEYLVKLCEGDYLKYTNEQLRNLLWEFVGINFGFDRIEELIKKINYSYKPIGTCTRDLKEYWLVNLDDKYKKSTPDEKGLIQNAKELITNYYDEFTKFKWCEIINKLGIKEVDFLNIYRKIYEIRQKNISQDSNNIVPNHDFSANYKDGNITVNYIGYSSEDNESFDISAEKKKDYDEDTESYIIVQYEVLEKAGKLSATDKKVLNGLRKKIKKFKEVQNETSLHIDIRSKIITQIIEFQKDFFASNNYSQLRPMKLEDIADRTGYHLSTIARIVSINSIETDRGRCFLKDLFSPSASNGDSRSLRYILRLIQSAINSEDEENPISDVEIKKLLFDEYSININIRTISNHREKKLNIRNAYIRKVIYGFNLGDTLIKKSEFAIFR